MNTALKDSFRPTPRRPGQPRPHERGLATVLFIILLSIMLILVTAESRSLFQLRREVKLLEQKQIQRLQTPATTNASAGPTGETK